MPTPPFTISPRAINQIAEISAQIERYANSVAPIKNDTVKYIMNNPSITIDELVVLTGKSRRTITLYIKQLQEEGRLKRVGSDKKGYWEIIK